MGGEKTTTVGNNIMKKIAVATTQMDMDEINEEINELIRTGMTETCNIRVVRKPTTRIHIRNGNKPWFTQKCSTLKKQLRNWGTVLSHTKLKPPPAFYGLKRNTRTKRRELKKSTRTPSTQEWLQPKIGTPECGGSSCTS